MKVLVVEDDSKLARFLARMFAEEGWVADTCARGADAIRQATIGVYDLIVLDWMLPDLDGVSVCRALREQAVATPILMLTARGELGEKVMGLDAGADDYLVKPFEIEELLARIRALMRRGSGVVKFRIGELEIDPIGRNVHLQGKLLHLTAREYALLLHLAQHRGSVVTRSDLLARVWGVAYDPGSNVVDAHMSRLRSKIGEYAAMIETVRGVGYRLSEASEP